MDLLLNVVIFLLVIGVLFWVITVIPIPEPFGRIAQVILGVIALIYLISLLFGVAQVPRLR